MQQDGGYHARIARATELLQSTRHMTLATVNANGTPHNSPVFFAYDTDLNFYWASGQDTQHSQNIARDGQVFITLFNSQENGGGLYIKAHAAPVSSHEFAASLAAVNAHRQAWGRPVAPPTMYQGDAPQRLYKAKPITMWVNVTEYDANGGPFKEYRREITPQLLSKGLGQLAPGQL